MSSIVDRFTSHTYQAITTGISAYTLDILTTAGIPTYKKPPSRNRAEYGVEGQGSVILADQHCARLYKCMSCQVYLRLT